MGHILAISNKKGGVGKRTATANLAHVLTNKKKRVLHYLVEHQGEIVRYVDIAQTGKCRQLPPILHAIASRPLAFSRPGTEAVESLKGFAFHLIKESWKGTFYSTIQQTTHPRDGYEERWKESISLLRTSGPTWLKPVSGPSSTNRLWPT